MTQSASSPNLSTSTEPSSRLSRERVATIGLPIVFLLTCGLYALLMLRDAVPLWTLAVLGSLWLVLLLSEKQHSFLTPMHVPIIGFLIILPINLLISANFQATLPKVQALLLSFSLFFAIIRLVRLRKHLPVLILALLALSLGAALLGLFATEWSGGILGFLSPIYEHLPRLSSLVAGASINKNTMGGALTFFPPLLLSLLWDNGAFKRLLAKYKAFKKLPIPLFKFLVLLTFTLLMFVLLLTQSRGAWLGTGFGIFVFLVWKDKRFLVLVPLGLAALVFIILNTGNGTLTGLLALLDQGQDSSLPGRLEIWSKIINLIRDFPVTGVGLDALGSVYPLYFNSFLFPEYSSNLFHAHNTLLSVTMEMGIPALILTIALLSSFFVMARRAWKHARTINRVLIMGLVCGMLAHQVFGIMDAFTLGKSLGVTMWIYYAIMAALFIHRDQMIHSKPPRNGSDLFLPKNVQSRYVLLGLASWLVLSIIAFMFCQISIYISLLLSLLAGILLGWFLTCSFFSLSSMSYQQPYPIG